MRVFSREFSVLMTRQYCFVEYGVYITLSENCVCCDEFLQHRYVFILFLYYVACKVLTSVLKVLLLHIMLLCCYSQHPFHTNRTIPYEII